MGKLQEDHKVGADFDAGALLVSLLADQISKGIQHRVQLFTRSGLDFTGVLEDVVGNTALLRGSSSQAFVDLDQVSVVALRD